MGADLIAVFVARLVAGIFGIKMVLTGWRFMILPVPVILTRLANDLFVFPVNDMSLKFSVINFQFSMLEKKSIWYLS